MAVDVHGILLLDKPLGMSSAGAVARAKRLLNARKAGHTGSLDPLASGMLPLCFGEATKFGAQMLDADKVYRVTARFGERTPSGDLESDVVERGPVPAFDEAQMREAVARFPREYAQIPPMHSAIKQDGRPLYEYARAGIVRERAARNILIHELRILEWRTPELSFEVRCSKGAYIRVLAEDLAATMGALAHLTALRRLAVAPFLTEPQWGFEALERMAPPELERLLLPVDAALQDRRQVILTAARVNALRQGQGVSVPEESPGSVRIYTEGLVFLGLGEVGAEGRLVPSRLIAAAANRA